ncbi:MAG: hypothetical protein Q8P51_10040 [Ignavibacteria bacterium]|nr:hypothetical protein [Ignavibacteria bacterium]
MPIDNFSANLVASLNQHQPNAECVHIPYLRNRQPWVRIFKSDWNEHWLRIDTPDENREYPVLWFEVKCLTNEEGHDGHPPYGIYLPIDERGINFGLGPEDYDPIPGRPGEFLPTPDRYLSIMHTLSACYQADVHTWVSNLSDCVESYLNERHFVRGARAYTLPRHNHPRKEVDSGTVTIEQDTDEYVQLCVEFIISRAATINCVMQAD